MWATIIIFALIIYYLVRYYSPKTYLPPGPLPLPFIGNLHQLDITDPVHTFNNWSKQYGGVYTVYIGQPMVVITDPDIMREALVKNGD